MAHQPGFWDVEYRLQELSRQGDPLEKLAATVDFELFRPTLRLAQQRRTIGKGGRPPFDPVLKFKMLVLQSMHGLPLEQTEFMVRDRLSWMRFWGLGPGDRVPDANTLWAEADQKTIRGMVFPPKREALIRTKTLDRLFARLDEAITAAGYLAMAISPCRARSWTPRWWQRRASATPNPRRRTSKPARALRRSGRTSPPGRHRKIRRRAGP